MSTKYFALTLLSIAFIACNNNQSSQSTTAQDSSKAPAKTTAQTQTSIPFTVAENYFVKNTIKGIDTPKIETLEKFDAIFGAATTMKNKPTPIDFSKQYAIALMQPSTDTAATIQPVSLQKDSSGTITLTYSLQKGNKQTYFITPTLVIIVDKSNTGNVVLKEQK